MIQIYFINSQNARQTLICEWRQNEFLSFYFQEKTDVTYDDIVKFNNWLIGVHSRDFGILTPILKNPINVIINGYKPGDKFKICKL